LDEELISLWYALLSYDLNWGTLYEGVGQAVLSNPAKNMIIIAATMKEALELAIERERELDTYRN